MSGPIVPSPAEFAAFLCAMRPSWDLQAVRGAITAAGHAKPEERLVGDHWCRIVRTFTSIACDPEATPKSLLDAVRNPVHTVSARMDDQARRELVDATLASLRHAAAITDNEGNEPD